MLDNAVPGSVIYAKRLHVFPWKTYEHYGIFAGNDQVIHFNDERGAHKVPLREFQSYTRSHECFVKPFPDNRETLERILKQKIRDSGLAARVFEEFNVSGYKFLTDAQALERAEEAVHSGEWPPSAYNLITRNCQHFVVWCKTNVMYSDQIERFYNEYFI